MSSTVPTNSAYQASYEAEAQTFIMKFSTPLTLEEVNNILEYLAPTTSYRENDYARLKNFCQYLINALSGMIQDEATGWSLYHIASTGPANAVDILRKHLIAIEACEFVRKKYMDLERAIFIALEARSDGEKVNQGTFKADFGQTLAKKQAELEGIHKAWISENDGMKKVQTCLNQIMAMAEFPCWNAIHITWHQGMERVANTYTGVVPGVIKDIKAYIKSQQEDARPTVSAPVLKDDVLYNQIMIFANAFRPYYLSLVEKSNIHDKALTVKDPIEQTIYVNIDTMKLVFLPQLRTLLTSVIGDYIELKKTVDTTQILSFLQGHVIHGGFVYNIHTPGLDATAQYQRIGQSRRICREDDDKDLPILAQQMIKYNQDHLQHIVSRFVTDVYAYNGLGLDQDPALDSQRTATTLAAKFSGAFVAEKKVSNPMMSRIGQQWDDFVSSHFELACAAIDISRAPMYLGDVDNSVFLPYAIWQFCKDVAQWSAYVPDRNKLADNAFRARLMTLLRSLTAHLNGTLVGLGRKAYEDPHEVQRDVKIAKKIQAHYQFRQPSLPFVQRIYSIAVYYLGENPEEKYMTWAEFVENGFDDLVYDFTEVIAELANLRAATGTQNVMDMPETPTPKGNNDKRKFRKTLRQGDSNMGVN